MGGPVCRVPARGGRCGVNAEQLAKLAAAWAEYERIEAEILGGKS